MARRITKRAAPHPPSFGGNGRFVPGAISTATTKSGKGAAASSEREKVEHQILQTLAQVAKLRKTTVYPFFLETIDAQTVEDVFDDVRQKIRKPVKHLDVIVHSCGGDIHAAFNLGLLFRRYASERLTFIVPRWAKSAATLMVCAGDEILLGPVSELGPVDPQITTLNPLENRLEQISPLYLKATLELIRTEFKEGNDDLAKGLLHRLQFPLTLGGFTRSLELGEGYIKKLLKTRMFASLGESDRVAKSDKVANTLVRAYEDHGYCIELAEARTMGLVAREIGGKQFDLVWAVFRLNDKLAALRKIEKQREMQELLKHLDPDEIAKRLPQERVKRHELSQQPSES
ncbi:MAG TPA: hypothetical protein VJ783_17245 [Pirellulales bacterium]|nr:hypothetical protein [Pirellulales bacterium]